MLRPSRTTPCFDCLVVNWDTELYHPPITNHAVAVVMQSSFFFLSILSSEVPRGLLTIANINSNTSCPSCALPVRRRLLFLQLMGICSHQGINASLPEGKTLGRPSCALSDYSAITYMSHVTGLLHIFMQ